VLHFEETLSFQNKPIDLLTVGELLIDMIPEQYGDQFEAKTFQKYFGGSPSNIAMNVKQLGLHPVVVSSVGNDGLGQFLIHHLEQAKIDTSNVQQIDASTSLVIVSKSKNSPVPIFYRDADYHLTYTEKLDKALMQAKIVHFSCWPISMDPSRQTIETIIGKAKEHHILTCFDPNYHPMIWKKGEDGIPFVKSIISQVDIIKPSEDDAERLFGKDTPENQLAKFLDLGAKLVILTLGKDGAIASNGKETFTFPTLADKVIDTTGAGDAFWSGLYTGLVQGQSIKEAIQLGFAVSAYKLQYTGAVVSLPTVAKLKEMYHV